jgi:rubrerythrin
MFRIKRNGEPKMTFPRTKFLAGSAAIAMFGPALMQSVMKEAEAATPRDIDLLNKEIELENAGIKAYTDAFKLNLLSPPVLEVAKRFRSDHQAHAEALAAAVRSAGGRPSTGTTKLEYPPLTSEADILAFAEKVERFASTAYLDDIGKLSNPVLAKLMASILGVETTHIAMLAAALKQPLPPYQGFVS